MKTIGHCVTHDDERYRDGHCWYATNSSLTADCAIIEYVPIVAYTDLLEVAIARGERLGYADDEYRGLWRELTGSDWRAGQ